MDTEENIDIYFTRPIGLVLTLICKRLGIHPNAVTIFSFFLGAGAGWMFWHTDLWHNVCGVLLLMSANFCDSVDGQLARMTGKKTLTGRMLDGFASDVWFACVYVAICFRLQGENFPGLNEKWGVGIWMLCSVAGFIAHTRQCRISDYYRNIHLFFLLGKEGAELNSYESQKAIADKYRREKNWVGVLFFANYAKYCRAQEAMTPEFQRMKARLTERYGGIDNVPQTFRDEFRRDSLPLMKYTNFLTHNWRAFVLFFSCLIGHPWIYPLFEITVMHIVAVRMHHTHETMCKRLADKYTGGLTYKALLMDFGGTIDTHGDHWGKVLWHAYERCDVPVTEEQFRDAYVFAERKLGKEHIVMPDFTYRKTLQTKIQIQLQWLRDNGIINATDNEAQAMAEAVLADIYGKVCDTISRSRKVLADLRARGIPMVLVSNFYGNMHTVLDEFSLTSYFSDVVESAVVGVRKPDTAIYKKGIECLHKVNAALAYDDICMVGDSIDKDILPAKKLGCKAIRVNGEPWTSSQIDDFAPDCTIQVLEELITNIKA